MAQNTTAALVAPDGWQRVAQEIRDRRHVRGWTQRDLARESGTGFATVRLAEKGTAHKQWPRSLSLIVAALEWPVDEARSLVQSNLDTDDEGAIVVDGDVADRLLDALRAVVRLSKVAAASTNRKQAWQIGMLLPGVLDGLDAARDALGWEDELPRWDSMRDEIRGAVAAIAAPVLDEDHTDD